MNTQNKNDFDGLNPVVIKNNKGYFFYLNEVKVYGFGASLDEAYSDIKSKYSDLKDKYEVFGVTDIRGLSLATPKNMRLRDELITFSAKILLLIFLVTIGFIGVLPIANTALKNTLSKVGEGLISNESRDPKYWAIKFPTDINSKLNSLTIEERSKMLKQWNDLLTQTAPIWKPLKCN